MSVYPVVSGNPSQTLFNIDMSRTQPYGQTAKLMAGSKSVVDFSLIDVKEDNMKSMMPAFLEQSNLSTAYQNNPWTVLMDSMKYGIKEPLGGPISPDQSPGYRPGNVLKKKTQRVEQFGNTHSTPKPKHDHKKGHNIGQGSFMLIVCFILIFVLCAVMIGLEMNKK